MKALETWRQQDLAPDARARLRDLIDARRHEADDQAKCNSLLEAFLATLTEPQLVVFARLLRELTGPVH